MDLDFDLDDDKIKSFLQSKLEEIKSKNDQLEHTIHDRQQFLKRMMKNFDQQMDESSVKFSAKVWKIFNGKYVLGISITNEGSGYLYDVKSILSWNSTYPFSYHMNLYEENKKSHLDSFQSSVFCSRENCDSLSDSLNESSKVDEFAYLIITFDQPQFIDKLSYHITGNVIFKQDDSEICLAFPSVEISALDATNRQLNDFPIGENGIKDVLTIISTSIRTDLVLIFPREWSNSINSTFEILCALRKIDVPSRCRKFFVAHRLSLSFDGSLVEVHAPNKTNANVSYAVIYTRNQDYLFSLLHHLHQNIPGVIIIPKDLHDNYILQHTSCISQEEGILEKFNQCVDKEIKFVKKFLHKHQGIQNTDDKVIKFGSDLADLEKSTDSYYLRICKINNENVE